eukprot:gnl/MRDRNA2_/MRDRNA2_28315_c0_seq2.p1 gnl/MRDRNA2_/MRDRNA2_28315_c0~~gnl/MRDRNA2_/MRDRNA2_28315_c0_seq2.p1  ORF type:complete len:462 (+),score=77.55 gnl/MRDRNA2_/MRDRNA2_28315_c0_seq2:141-1526(+)
MKLEIALGFVLQQFSNVPWEDLAKPEATVCVVIMFFSGVLCAAAGIGGGGIIVTVLMFFGHLSPHDAVPMSKAIVFMGAVSSGFLNIGKKFRGGDGKLEQPLVDWRIVKLTVPMALIGTLFGVLLNRETPGWQIVLLLTGILCLMTGMLVHKAVMQYFAELYGRRQNDEQELNDEENSALLGNTQDGDSPSDESQSDVHVKDHLGQNCYSSIDVVYMGSLLIVVIIGSVLRDHAKSCRNEKMQHENKTLVGESACNHPILTAVFGAHMEQWMENEGLASFIQSVMVIVPIWICLSIAMYYGYKILQDGWDMRRIMIFQSIALLTGCLAGLVGIGGGLVLSPFFLLYGVEPSVAVATSSTCVIFTSSSTTIQYLLMDRIRVVLAVFYGFANLFASLIGTGLVHYLQDTFASRKSYITLIVALGVAASMVLSIIKLVEELQPMHSAKVVPEETIVLFGTDTAF